MLVKDGQKKDMAEKNVQVEDADFHKSSWKKDMADEWSGVEVEAATRWTATSQVTSRPDARRYPTS